MVDTRISDDSLPPAFTTVGGAVQQPGTTVPGHMEYPQHFQNEKPQKKIQAVQVAASKYAVLQFQVDNVRSYQLLPQDLQRKVAWIRVPLAAANGIAIGPLTLVENGQGYPLLNGDPEHPFTCGSPLYAKGLSGTAVIVNILVEMYDGVVTVN